jgi:hypothetical protein
MYLLHDQEYREGMPLPLSTVSRSVTSISQQDHKLNRKNKQILPKQKQMQ